MMKQKVIGITTGVVLALCFIGGVSFATVKDAQNGRGPDWSKMVEEKSPASQKANTEVNRSSGFVPMGKEIVDNTTDCNKLQHMFDTVYEGHNFVTNTADALDYVDRKMRAVGCY